MPTEEELEQRITAHIDSPFTKEEREIIRRMLAKEGGAERVEKLAKEFVGGDHHGENKEDAD